MSHMHAEPEKIALARKLANEVKLHWKARGLVLDEISRIERGGIVAVGNEFKRVYSLDEIIENLLRMPKA